MLKITKNCTIDPLEVMPEKFVNDSTEDKSVFIFGFRIYYKESIVRTTQPKYLTESEYNKRVNVPSIGFGTKKKTATSDQK